MDALKQFVYGSDHDGEHHGMLCPVPLALD